MDLTSDNTFWPIKNGIPSAFAELTSPIECEVLVLGGGITGALIADSFSKAGISTVVVEKRRIAHGSTSASTALLQYEIDTPLYKLQDMIGVAEARTAYRLCGDSINYIEKLTQEMSDDCGFRKHPSLYIASAENDVEWLQLELEARKQAGFSVDWRDKDQVATIYGLESHGAIRSELGGQVDPYRFTYRLLERVQARGGKIFENTPITSIIETDSGILARTNDGQTITAKKIIFAVGYEAYYYLKEKTADLKSTYACVSKPLHSSQFWAEQCLVWNTSDPYFYARITEDQRILIGGEDIDYHDDKIRDSLILDKQQKLKETFTQLFPRVSIEIEYAWAGTFGETKDGLPYIGESPEWKHAYFALGYGGNGITFSAIAAKALLESYLGSKPSYLDIFKFGR